MLLLGNVGIWFNVSFEGYVKIELNVLIFFVMDYMIFEIKVNRWFKWWKSS